jgi:hypothetical protein
MVKHRSGTLWPDDREVRKHCVWSAPCIRRRGARVSWFGLKTKVGGFPGLGLKTGSCDLAHKITVTVSWFGLQNQAGDGLSVAPQNQRENEDSVGYASRSSALLHLEARRARVS